MKEEILNKWLTSNWLDSSLKEELSSASVEEQEAMLLSSLEFGTGGMRGIIGPGDGRMNSLTVARATLGFGQYLLNQGKENELVIIGYDNRKYSSEFADISARVLVKLGFKVDKFADLTATPIVSYAIRRLKASAGIMITASHNPPEYNGYKIYDSTGCQFLPESMQTIIENIDQLANEFDIPLAMKEIPLLDFSMESAYVKEFETVVGKEPKELRIGYSPQHGTGAHPMKALFDYYRFNQVTYATEQFYPDSNFSNTVCPNPEKPEAFDLLLKYGKNEKLDLLLSNDPDADRMGAFYRNVAGSFERLTGNQIGAIFSRYLLENKAIDNKYIVKTIVTSNLGAKIAKSYGCEVIEVLTGFKYIGDVINKKGQENFLLGYEESFGYLFDPIVRDKDGIQACLLLGTIADTLKQRNKTLGDYLEEVYAMYGYYYEGLTSIEICDAKELPDLYMYLLQAVKTFGKIKIVENYLTGTRHIIPEKKIETIKLPREKVTKYQFEDDSWVCVRPSGTEPKVKIYFGVTNSEKKAAQTDFQSLSDKVNTLSRDCQANLLHKI